jgi:hypothetical protein
VCRKPGSVRCLRLASCAPKQLHHQLKVRDDHRLNVIILFVVVIIVAFVGIILLPVVRIRTGIPRIGTGECSTSPLGTHATAHYGTSIYIRQVSCTNNGLVQEYGPPSDPPPAKKPDGLWNQMKSRRPLV